jgi:hypothetical protein
MPQPRSPVPWTMEAIVTGQAVLKRSSAGMASGFVERDGRDGPWLGGSYKGLGSVTPRHGRYAKLPCYVTAGR